METRLSRRALLVRGGGAAAALAGAGLLVDALAFPGRGIAGGGGVRCGDIAPLPDVVPGAIERGAFRSAARGCEVHFALVYPPGVRPGAPLPVCLYLHGRGGSHRNVADPAMGLPWYLADRVAAGAPALALLAVDGGDNWWHGRASGDDPQRMLLDEVLPLAARRGLQHRPHRAARHLHGRLRRDPARRAPGSRARGRRRCPLAGAVPPLRGRDGGRVRLARRLRGPRRLRPPRAPHGIAVRMDCGTDDRYGFAGACRAFLDGAPLGVTGTMTPGCHDTAYWRSIAPHHVEHVARALAA